MIRTIRADTATDTGAVLAAGNGARPFRNGAREGVSRGEKEKFAQQLEQLERQMQQQQQSMAGGQPDASSKLRQALSDAEQKELAMRMQKERRMDSGRLRRPEHRNGRQRDGRPGSAQPRVARCAAGAEIGQSAGTEWAERQRGARTLAQVRALREELEQRAQQGGQQGSKAAQQSSNPGNKANKGSRTTRAAGRSAG